MHAETLHDIWWPNDGCLYFVNTVQLKSISCALLQKKWLRLWTLVGHILMRFCIPFAVAVSWRHEGSAYLDNCRCLAPSKPSLHSFWKSWNLLTWAVLTWQKYHSDFLFCQKPIRGVSFPPKLVCRHCSIFGRVEVDQLASEVSTHNTHWFSLTKGTSPGSQDGLTHWLSAGLLVHFPCTSADLASTSESFRKVTGICCWPSSSQEELHRILHRICRSVAWRLPNTTTLSSLGGLLPGGTAAQDLCSDVIESPKSFSRC